MTGQTISHYHILEQLGEGGMGVVYKADDTRLKRAVALKFLPARLSASPQDKARFVQEAQAASALNHPNVCTIHDIQEHEGQMFIVMEYVDGQTLRAKMGQLSRKQGIEIGIQIAEGLAAAHEKGIVHRDIKPENIMVRRDGIAQIMDFGLAKLRGTVTRLTREGSTVGTAGYMSPEQVQGQEADHRSDIFSLGVLLYEMFTGQLPFKGVHETALAYEIVNVDAAPMSSAVPDIDASLDAIVLECLQKDPNERMQSAKQVAIDLKRFKRESSRQHVSRVAPARAVPRSGAQEPAAGPRRRWMWPAITGVLAVALGVSVWQLQRRAPGDRSIARFSIVLPAGEVFETANYPALAVSPDGSRIIYSAGGKLYQRKLDNLTAEPIPGTEDATSPFFSPDGRWLAFFVTGYLKKTAVSLGSPIVVAEAQNNRGGTWTQDGRIIFTLSGRGPLFEVSENGGEVRALTTLDSTKNERTHRWSQALPDGKTVIFTVGTAASPDYYEDASIDAVDLKTGKRKTLLTGASSARYVTSGHLVYSHAGTLFAVPFDLERVEVTGPAIPLVENMSSDVTTGAAQCAFSSTGLLAYIPGKSTLDSRSLVVVDRSGSSTTLAATPQSYADLRISPDGKRIAVAVQSGKGFDIWVYDIGGKTMTRLTFGGANRSPLWSPDGQRIAYSSNNISATTGGGTSKVVILKADGGGSPEEVVFNCDRNYVTGWSKDGSTILLTVPEPGMGWDLWVLPLTGDRKPWRFMSTKSDEAYASLSPDGKWIAYISNASGVNRVYVRPFPRGDGEWQISADLAFNALWSPDGRMLYYVSTRDIMAVQVSGTSALTAGQPAVVLKGFQPSTLESAASFDVTPDGRSILLTKAQEDVEKPRHLTVVLNAFEAIRESAVAEH